MDKRPEEPIILKQWRDWVNAGPPKVCHSCNNYDLRGNCLHFKMRPPDEFVLTEDACSAWKEEVPF